MLGVVAIDEILHNAAALEDPDLSAVGVGVGQGWDSAVRVDSCEPGRFLLVDGHIDFAGREGQAELCQRDADFDAVW